MSAVDVSVRAEILHLLQDLREEMGVTILFIGYDLRVAPAFCDQAAVMDWSKLVEVTPAEALFCASGHPYKEVLLFAVAEPHPHLRGQKRCAVLPGEVPDSPACPRGCVFRPRCPAVFDRCRNESPALTALGDGRAAACWRHEVVRSAA